MEPSAVPDNLQRQLREFVAQQIGLHFPPNRWGDLERGLAGAMGEFGFVDLVHGAEWLLSMPLTKNQIDVLASHLTIGETYFFREKKTFEILAEKVLPQLIYLRRQGERRLRIWSAACCTGEEAYSLAILLQQVVPDLADWFVTILATDINARFLQKAVAGIYGKWSFRDTPPWFKDRYFKLTEDGRYALLPEIKKRVTFAQVNLVQDSFPSLVVETNAMDVILCRNVLMYFSPSQAQKVVHSLRRALVNNGWLIVGASEASQTLFSQFAQVNFPGVILYQKRREIEGGQQFRVSTQLNESTPVVRAGPEVTVSEVPMPAWVSPALEPDPAEDVVTRTNAQQEPYVVAKSLYESGQYAEVVNTLLGVSDSHVTPDLKTFSMLTRALANQGKLTEALRWCDRWVDADKLDASSYYLRAVILQELGESEQPRRSLQTAIYLEPQFVLAHFALGNLARNRSKIVEANKHFANASRLLRDYQPGDVLPESDGLTAGRLSEIITSIAAMGGNTIETEAKQILRARARSLAQGTRSAPVLEAAVEVLEFRLAQERYAVESQYVQEVHPLKELTPLPCTPSFVAGIVNVRGRVVPVLDLKKLLDLPAKGLTDLHHIILVRGEDFEVGILADVIMGVSSIPIDTLQPSLPTLTGVRSEYLKGLTGERLVILDLARILADPRIIVNDEVEG